MRPGGWASRCDGAGGAVVHGTRAGSGQLEHVHARRGYGAGLRQEVKAVAEEDLAVGHHGAGADGALGLELVAAAGEQPVASGGIRLLEGPDDAERRLGEGPANGTVDPVVVVFTDGLENASQRITRADLFARIGRLRDAGWTFVFLGANQDSYLEAGRLGFAGANTQNFRGDSYGMRTASGDFSRGLTSMRGKVSRERVMHKVEFFDGRKDAEQDDDTR